MLVKMILLTFSNCHDFLNEKELDSCFEISLKCNVQRNFYLKKLFKRVLCKILTIQQIFPKCI